MKLIQTKKHLLLIGEKGSIKENQLGWDGYYIEYFRSRWQEKDWSPVIAYFPLTKEAKELDLPLLPNPFKEGIDVEELALKAYPVLRISGGDFSPDVNKEIRRSFIVGYKAAQSKQIENIKSWFWNSYRHGRLGQSDDEELDSLGFEDWWEDRKEFIQEDLNKSQSKQFSLEDMQKAFKAGEDLEYWKCMNTKENPINFPNTGFEEDFIQSLSTQQLPKEFHLGDGDTIKEQIKKGNYEY